MGVVTNPNTPVSSGGRQTFGRRTTSLNHLIVIEVDGKGILKFKKSQGRDERRKSRGVKEGHSEDNPRS